MGVLEFSLSSGVNPAQDILSFDIEDVLVEQNEYLDQQINSPRTKRKRSKSGGTCYDFRDHVVDSRRRGAKHQRRKQNFCDLLQMVDGDECLDESLCFENHMTVFAELFMDEKKMKIWEGFMNLPEDRQREYLEDLQEHHLGKPNGTEDVRMIAEEEMQFLLIDTKIRDMLRAKKLAHDGLLKYYEDDMLSCMNEWFPSVIVMNFDEKYDRMLIYALCQYMCLTWNTVKLKNSTIIEIELAHDSLKTPDIMLTDYLKKNTIN